MRICGLTSLPKYPKLLHTMSKSHLQRVAHREEAMMSAIRIRADKDGRTAADIIRRILMGTEPPLTQPEIRKAAAKLGATHD